MAKDANPAELTDAPPKKSKKLLIIIAAVVLLLAALAVAAVLLLKSSPSDDEEADEEVAEESVKKSAKKKDKGEPPVFVSLDTFTVNLAPENGEQYLQVIISVELDSADSQAQLTAMMPRIRNNVTLLLSSKKASELQPKEGKENLAKESAAEINADGIAHFRILHTINPSTQRGGWHSPTSVPPTLVAYRFSPWQARPTPPPPSPARCVCPGGVWGPDTEHRFPPGGGRPVGRAPPRAKRLNS